MPSGSEHSFNNNGIALDLNESGNYSDCDNESDDDDNDSDGGEGGLKSSLSKTNSSKSSRSSSIIVVQNETDEENNEENKVENKIETNDDIIEEKDIDSTHKTAGSKGEKKKEVVDDNSVANMKNRMRTFLKKLPEKLNS